ncbi:MAG TPA: zinc-ribbon domain-containing protein [Polyangiaceae bacterium]|jgi:predicted Zn finger-like uncharacterized protein|nr:zinc-ribbon domain-containing protein [Polyangiaceae bacterium]
MKITCQSCQSKYNVADEKVQGKIVKIRCRKCGSTIVVQGNGGAAANGTNGAGTGGGEEALWHVNAGDGEPRQMTMAELIDAYNTGAVAQDTFIWTDGMDDWKPLSEVEPVVTALHAADTSADSSYKSGVNDAPMAAAAAPAPAPEPEPAPAPEPKRAAVKREQRARDLFGTGVAAEEVQTSAPAVPQMMSSSAVDDAAGKMTGQRNENSVLFSLAVLTKDADERAPDEPAPKSTTRNQEDSGLIDLKALALKAESMRPPGSTEANAFASPLGLGMVSAPLGAPMGVLGGPLGEAPQKSKLPLIIGGVVGIILLLVVGIGIGVKVAGSGPVPEASATASAAPAYSAPEPVATASATASATAEAPPPPPSASVAAKPKPAYHAPSGGGAAPKPAGGGGTAAAGAAGAATPAAPTPPPPKKAGSDCGCNGDLMCLMKCSTH